MPVETPSPGEGAGEATIPQGWSRRAEIAFVGIAMPVMVFLLVIAPYLMTHYMVNRHFRFNYIPPPLGGERALEGHWTDAPVVAVRNVNFGADWSAFGWIAADGDRTTNVLPTMSGTVSQVFASVGQVVAKDAPLFSIRTRPSAANSQAEEITVAAPVAGAVTALAIAVGQAVKPARDGPAAASIADLSTLWLVAEIDENDARALRRDQAVDVRPTALPGKVLNGRVAFVSPADAKTGRAVARIVVDNSDGALKLGMLAQFAPEKAENSESPAIPESAVLFENGGARVFVAAEDSDAKGPIKFTPREIKIGRIRDGLVEVLEGLAPGENVEASDALFIDRAAKGY
jgi:multidrug efflux pump subunit AcrA (membrane-fusion protein)